MVKVWRAAAVAAILVNLAILSAHVSLSSTSLRYQMGERRREILSLEAERLRLVHEVALARRPDAVVARALAFGIDLRTVENDRIVRSAGPSPAPRAVVRAPRP